MSILLAVKALKEDASLVDLLSRLGYEPVKKSNHEKFYISMLRDNDRTPSFTVNDDLGVWFDHGIRKGGNIIDFGLAYWKHLRFGEVIQKLTAVCAMPLTHTNPVDKPLKTRPRLSLRVPNYIVTETKSLGTHPAITNYLKGRGIFEMARLYLSEIYYYVEDDKGIRKHFFSAGWQNENKGWEVRNKLFKGCIGHQGITVLKGNEKKAALFEGMMNFLSWRSENPQADHSIIVLNSVSALKAGIAKAKAFSLLDTYFDRDKAGFSATRDFLAALPYATDRSKAYDGFNDYNDKIMDGLKIDTKNPKAHGFLADLKVPFER